MKQRRSSRIVAHRLLTYLTLGLLVTGIGAPSAYAADETSGDSASVTISVIIDEFEPCAAATRPCVAEGALAVTGLASVGLPVGLGVVAASMGTALYVMDRRRRSDRRGTSPAHSM